MDNHRREAEEERYWSSLQALAWAAQFVRTGNDRLHLLHLAWE